MGVGGLAKAGRSVGAESRLEYRLKRLMFFRVVMITTLLLIAAYAEAVAPPLLPVNPLYFLIAATYALTIVYALALRYWPFREAQAHVQIFFDLIVVSGLVYVTGGGGMTGFTLFYPISVLSASVLLYRRTGLTFAALATSFYAVVLSGVRAGWFPRQGIDELASMSPKQLAYSVVLVGTSCATVALIGAYLSENLKDVGQRLKVVAEEVADLRELNEAIVNSIHSGLLTTDSEGRILYLNPFGEAILGQGLPELRGRSVAEVLGSDLVSTPVLQARETLPRLTRLEVTYSRPDSRRVDLGISVSLLEHTRQHPSGHLLVFQDLTEIKRLEQEVSVKEKLAAVGEMASYLAHEIRNPLGSISGSAQVLMGEPNISREQERLLDIIRRESQRLSQSVEQFLHHVRPKGHLLAPVDVGPIITEAVTLLRNDRDVAAHHSVDFEAEPGAYVCLADRDQLTQVFWNLARNGLEAMPNGGTLQVRLRCDGEQILLSIRDHGRGMAEEEQRRMFEPFQSSMPKGTGLGLAIVYRIVREHHGDITVRSLPFQGTTVEVRLPLATTIVASGAGSQLS